MYTSIGSLVSFDISSVLTSKEHLLVATITESEMQLLKAFKSVYLDML
jgi:hypothetical protein